MTPATEDVTIQGKRGLCGFASTNLDFVLRQKGVDTLLLAGFLVRRDRVLGIRGCSFWGL
jgi:ureidoacrylate peracid hydrolase